MCRHRHRVFSGLFYFFLFLLVVLYILNVGRCLPSLVNTSHRKQASSASTPSPFELLRNQLVYVSCGKSLCGRGGLKLYADSDEMHLVTKSLESNSRRILFRFILFLSGLSIVTNVATLLEII